MILSTKCESLELLWYVLSHVQYNVLNYFSCSICLNYIFFFVQSSQSVFNYSGLTYSNFSCCPSGWACYCFRAMTMLFTNERSLRSTNGSTRTFFCQPHADHWLPDKKRGRRKKSDEEGGGLVRKQDIILLVSSVMHLAVSGGTENIRSADMVSPCTEYLAYFAVKLMQLQEAGGPGPGCLQLVHGACIFN